MKKIKVFGEEITIKFNMGVQLAYEKISGKPFFSIELQSVENRAILYMAAILHNNPDTSITIDTLLNAPQSDLLLIDKAIAEEMEDWYDIPSTCNDEEALAESEEKV